MVGPRQCYSQHRNAVIYCLVCGSIAAIPYVAVCVLVAYLRLCFFPQFSSTRYLSRKYDLPSPEDMIC